LDLTACCIIKVIYAKNTAVSIERTWQNPRVTASPFSSHS